MTTLLIIAAFALGFLAATLYWRHLAVKVSEQSLWQMDQRNGGESMTDRPEHYRDFGSEDVTQHVIGVKSPEEHQQYLERRPEPRRSEDRQARDEAAKFRQLMIDLRFKYDFWLRLYRKNPNSYHEGRVTAYAEMLGFYGENEREKEGCSRIGENQ
jgi:hypothetical protein